MSHDIQCRSARNTLAWPGAYVWGCTCVSLSDFLPSCIYIHTVHYQRLRSSSFTRSTSKPCLMSSHDRLRAPLPGTPSTDSNIELLLLLFIVTSFSHGWKRLPGQDIIACDEGGRFVTFRPELCRRKQSGEGTICFYDSVRTLWMPCSLSSTKSTLYRTALSPLTGSTTSMPLEAKCSHFHLVRSTCSPQHHMTSRRPIAERLS